MNPVVSISCNKWCEGTKKDLHVELTPHSNNDESVGWVSYFSVHHLLGDAVPIRVSAQDPVVPPRVVTKPLASVSYPVDLHAQAATELIDNGASVGFVELCMCHRVPPRGITLGISGGA